MTDTYLLSGIAAIIVVIIVVGANSCFDVAKTTVKNPKLIPSLF